MKHLQFILFVLSLLFAAGLTRVNSHDANQTGVVIESGTFRFLELKQIRGDETYKLSQSSNGELILDARTALPFAELIAGKTFSAIKIIERRASSRSPQSLPA